MFHLTYYRPLHAVPFPPLQDDIVANTFEGVAATLKNAKAKKIVSYNSPLLLQGAHDNVDIILNKEHIPTEESQ